MVEMVHLFPSFYHSNSDGRHRVLKDSSRIIVLLIIPTDIDEINVNQIRILDPLSCIIPTKKFYEATTLRKESEN